MSNTNLTVDWIGNEALRLAHEKLSFIGTINREFDSSFKPGYGNTIRIRIPSQYTVTTGRVIDVQDSVQQSTNIVVATQRHVALRYNSQELSQDLVNFQKLHLEPAMAVLAADVENTVLTAMTQATYNVVGLPGSAITTLQYPGLARGRMNQNLAPKDSNRAVVFDSVTMSEMINGAAAYFNPQSAISDQYREGFIARTAMADYYENDKVYSQANSASVSSWNSVALTNGINSITVSSAGTAATVGMTFKFGHTSTAAAALYAVHPETKAVYTHQQDFVCTAGTSITTINFSPPIYLSGPRQNVARADGTAIVGTGAVSTALLRFTGALSVTYPTPLMYHRDAFTFATAPLPMMDDAIRCVVKTYDGISLRVWEASDIRNDEKITRIDILFGQAAIRPQWACRLIGTGV